MVVLRPPWTEGAIYYQHDGSDIEAVSRPG